MGIARLRIPALVAALAFSPLAGCMDPGGLGRAAPARAAASPFSNPPQVVASHGVAKLALSVEIDPATGLPAFVYEGRVGVAPTIRIRPGDTLAVDVTDRLPPGRGMLDDVNLHFHGLTVSPKAPADDAIGMLAGPGQTLHYVIPVPATQEPGLYWYHPHVHAQSNLQVGDAGMSGALVVDGIEKRLSALASMPENLLVMRDVADGPQAARGPRTFSLNDPCGPDRAPVHLTIDGIARPTIRIAPGQAEFFRLVNATAHRTLDLQLDGIAMQVVAEDGYPIGAFAGAAASVTRTRVVVPPAGRVEFVATGTASSELRTLCYDSGPVGDPDPAEVLADLRPGNAPSRAQEAPAAPRRGAGAAVRDSYASQSVPAPAASRTVTLTEDRRGYYINGRAYQPLGPPMFVVRTGTVEEWTIRNASDEIHDFHIHQVHFFIESVDGVAQVHRAWRDTVVVPVRTRRPGGSWKAGEVKLLVDFRNPVIRGTFVFHCHILDHEDGGMMAKVQAI